MEMVAMTDEARITAVPLHDWVVRAVYRMSADGADAFADGGTVELGSVKPVRFEGPNCLHCGVLYEAKYQGADCSAAARQEVATVKF